MNIQLLQELLQNQIIMPNSAVRRGAQRSRHHLRLRGERRSHRVGASRDPGRRRRRTSGGHKGLAVGEMVVTEGGDRLRDGAAVLLPGAAAGGRAAHPPGGAKARHTGIPGVEAPNARQTPAMMPVADAPPVS